MSLFTRRCFLESLQTTRLFVMLALTVFAIGTRPVGAATITMTGSDTSGQSSFTVGTHWDDGLAPSADNDYVNSGYGIRTPTGTSNYTFGGKSLTLGGVNTTALNIVGSGIITITDLRMQNGAYISNYRGNSTTVTLAGSLTVGTGGARILPSGTSRTIAMLSTIHGTGLLQIGPAPSGSAPGATVILAGAGSDYSGGTTVNGAALIVTHDGALGTGNVTLQSGGSLTLQSGVLNDYIGNSADLILVSGLGASSVNLNYSGTDYIGRLSLDGGTHFLDAGSYDADALNSIYGTTVFVGTGLLEVVPEPSALGLLLLAVSGLWMVKSVCGSRLRRET